MNVYFKTKTISTENSKSISNFLNECFNFLKSHNKIICSVYCDDYTANLKACNFELNNDIYRQNCNRHCAALALSHQFIYGRPNHDITIKTEMALRLLKNLNPPFFSFIKWKSISECHLFIVDNLDELKKNSFNEEK